MDGWAGNGLDEHSHSVDPAERIFCRHICCCAMDAGKKMMMLQPSSARGRSHIVFFLAGGIDYLPGHCKPCCATTSPWD